MRLGYERILMDKRIFIEVDEDDNPWVMLKMQDYPEVIKIKVSDTLNEIKLKDIPSVQDDIKEIVQIVHQAYCESLKPF